MKKLVGKSLLSTSNQEIEGEAIVSVTPITFLGFLDSETGKIMEKNHPLEGISIKGKIFVFPKGIGSTVGPYVLVNLAKRGNTPALIINRESDQGTVAGCSITRIPLVYGLDKDPIDQINTGDRVRVKILDGVAMVTVL